MAPVALLQDSSRPAIALPNESLANQPGNLDAILYEIDGKPNASQGDTVQKPTETSAQVAPTVAEKVARETVDTTGPVEPKSGAESLRSKKRSGDVRQGADPNRADNYRANKTDDVVREFTPGRMYRVVVPTRAMAGPTLRGRPLTELDVDDRVLVEARLGAWLKIRSKKGQIAYILSQDAQEVGEGEQP